MKTKTQEVSETPYVERLYRRRSQEAAAQGGRGARKAPSGRHVRRHDIGIAPASRENGDHLRKSARRRARGGSHRQPYRDLRGQRGARERHVRPRGRDRRHPSALRSPIRERAWCRRRWRSASADSSRDRPVLRAIVLGYDICARLLLALKPMPFLRSGHHAGAFGSCSAPRGSGSAAGARRAAKRATCSRTPAEHASGLYTMFRDPEHIEKAYAMGGMPAHNGTAAALMVDARLHRGRRRVFRGARLLFHVCAAGRRRSGSARARSRQGLRDDARRYQALAGRRADPGTAARAARTDAAARHHGGQWRSCRTHPGQGPRNRQQPRHAGHLGAAPAGGDAARTERSRSRRRTISSA